MTKSLVMETVLSTLFMLWSTLASNNTIRSTSWSLSIISRLFMHHLTSLPVTTTDIICYCFLVMGEFVGRYMRKCLWSISTIPSVLRWAEWNFILFAFIDIFPYTCSALHPCFGYLSSKYSQYSAIVYVGFTEWFVALFCLLDNITHAWRSWWNLVSMHSSGVVFSSLAHFVLGWTNWCYRAHLLPDIMMWVSGRFSLCYLFMHSINAFQPRSELQPATSPSLSTMFRFLSFVYGLRLGLVMSLFMTVKFRASGPALKLFWFGERGIYVVPLTCECADSHSWGLTMSFRACRYGNTLSWCLLDLPLGSSCLSGVIEDQTYLALISVQHQTQPEDACTRNGPIRCTFVLVWQYVCTLLFGVLLLPHIVTYLIY